MQKSQLKIESQAEKTIVRIDNPAQITNLNYILNKKKSQKNLLIIIIAKNGQVYNLPINISQQAINTKSVVTVKSVSHGNSKINVKALISIKKNAENSTAIFSHKALLLSKKSGISTLPSLEIMNKNSSASHKIKISKPDKNELFYIQTRGFSLRAAKKILINAFLEND